MAGRAGLKGKTILVTGGSRGIGAACVATLAEAGAHVVLHYHSNGSAARRLAGRFEAGRVLPIRADLGAPDGPSALWKRALAWRRRIDVLVNNAGIMDPAGIDAPLTAWRRAWRRALQVNLIATADLCREALRHYRRSGGGVVINIASRAAFRGDSPDLMHYAASKGGVIALTRSIARGFGRDNVLAYAIAPGFVDTEMNAGEVKKHGRAALTRELPLGEFAPAQDVADAVAFFAAGPRHATGTTLDINGASYVR